MSLSLSDRIKALIQYPLPHHLLSRLMYRITRIEWRPFKNAMIRLISKRFDIDITLAKEQNLDAYPHFNSFFTRPLRDGVRPVVAGADTIACPVDGTISQIEAIRDGRIFQAKGHDYSLQALLGGYSHLHDLFVDGQFTTIYLSPRDYHRIHMPLTGKLKEMLYIPGRLFSVSPATTRAIPGLFARNERLVTVFETEFGPMAVILVGAIFVAGIETVWTENFGDKMFRRFQHWDYANDKTLPAITLEKGAEMGRFNMGSTVILLFGKQQMEWSKSLHPEQAVQMGQLIGQRLS
jgi:phosphatidylserine decarboxylase